MKITRIDSYATPRMAAAPNAAPYLEYGIEDNDWIKETFSPALKMVDGQMQIPPGPGWGVEINPAWLEKAEHRVSTLDE